MHVFNACSDVSHHLLGTGIVLKGELKGELKLEVLIEYHVH